MGYRDSGVYSIKELVYWGSTIIRVKEDWRDVRKGEGLDLRAAKGGVIPFIGLVEVESKLISDVQTSVFLTVVPMLVARDEVEYTIIGYNVMEEMIRNKGQGRSKGAIVDIMSLLWWMWMWRVLVNWCSLCKVKLKKACVFEEWYELQCSLCWVSLVARWAVALRLLSQQARLHLGLAQIAPVLSSLVGHN